MLVNLEATINVAELGTGTSKRRYHIGRRVAVSEAGLPTRLSSLPFQPQLHSTITFVRCCLPGTTTSHIAERNNVGGPFLVDNLSPGQRCAVDRLGRL